MESQSQQEEQHLLTIPLIPTLNESKQNFKDSIQSYSDGNTPFFKTCFNGLNALSGVGILSVPYALSSGGWLSLIFLIIIAFSTFYTGLLIKRCMDKDSNIRTYPDIGYRAFGKRGRIVVSIIMNMELYLVAIGFLILEGDNLNNILPRIKLDLLGFMISGKQSFVVLVGLIILPTIWLNNMSILSYVSASGVLASVVILGSILWTAVFDGVGFNQKGDFVIWSGVPTSVSLYAFCYCAHPVFPTLYTSMKNKHQFSKVLFVCFGFCTVTYASMAILGYLMFGPNLEEQITLNLPTKNISSRIAICTTLVNPISKYALMVTPIVSTLENWFKADYKRRPFSLMIRTSLVISTVFFALVFPFFADLMSLVGAVLSVTASIILPCVCYLKISGEYKRFGAEAVIIVGIVLMGIVVVIVGAYASILKIVLHL